MNNILDTLKSWAMVGVIAYLIMLIIDGYGRAGEFAASTAAAVLIGATFEWAIRTVWATRQP